MPLLFLPRFDESYKRLPLEIRLKTKKALRLLDTDYRHPGLRSHPIKGSPGIFEAYIDDKYRMTYQRDGDTLILRNVDNHDECLREP
jgi:hypothetical protein